MSSDIAIRVEKLSKCYHIYDNPRDRLKQMFFWGRRQYYREFWALKEVSFEVRRGETVGIIGRNGSGKSTLLQLICGTLNPSGGAVETHGRVAALLELGSGFNSEFTGRENVYMNAAVLGLSTEEIDECYPSIEAFASIGPFMDQPIKTYSSGMVVRLAFAVQASVDPDVLIVDEALAVGDAKFQARCFARLAQLKERGTTIMLVTHSTEQIVTHCSRAILLEDGHVLEDGPPRQVANLYTDLLFGKEAKDPAFAAHLPPFTMDALSMDPARPPLETSKDVFATRPGYNPHEYRWGDQAGKILDFCLESEGVRYPSGIRSGARVDLWIAVQCREEIPIPVIGMTLKTKTGITLYGSNSEKMALRGFTAFGRRGSILLARLSFLCRLGAGDYFISIGLASRGADQTIPHDRRYDAIHLLVQSTETFFGLLDLNCEMHTEEIAP